MGRVYAGILGPLAMITVVVRGLRHNASTNETLLAAALGLLGFAAVGYVLGQAAAWIVEDSVRSQIAAELAAINAKTEKSPTAATT